MGFRVAVCVRQMGFDAGELFGKPSEGVLDHGLQMIVTGRLP